MAEHAIPKACGSSHAANVRGLAAGANPGQPFGRFGPMFPLPPCPALPEAGLAALAGAMVKRDAGAPVTEREAVDENDRIPSGYTYFGQFLDHDITFDPTPLGAKQVDPDALLDFRSPALDLDSVYGRGPADQPYLYERDGLRLRLGAQVNPQPLGPVESRLDLLRLPDGSAILGDKRNDENKIVSQLHGAFIAFHNKVVLDDAILDAFGADRSTSEARFAAAATLTRWHYQYVVVHDFLRRICEPGMVEEVLNPGGTPRLQHYLKQEAKYPYMPLEFAGAAYRFGHSMVRPSYSLNKVVLARKEGGDPTKERIPTFSRDPRGTENLNGFPGTLPPFWGIDWSFFLDDVEGVAGGVPVGGKPAVLPQPSYRIDALLAEPLGDLPEFFDTATPPGSPGSILGNLAFRNLKRGQLLRLPAGEEVARALGHLPMSDEVIWGAGSRLPPPDDTELRDALAETAERRRAVRQQWMAPGRTPLWYYILREAEYHGATEPTRPGAAMGGQHLGPVGSRIVAETIIGLLWLDPASFLHSSRGFRPLRAVSQGKPLTLGRLVSFALT
ncbi:peroxidase family protein [Roseicella aquatilis]|uniref:Peroxidase n=1 Tax=Roseicella aquatilis TaxID=2527868 RepID=A0A4R4DFN3_9PROT|nr:heme peroxidase family protein [Roseicella aquatilis]TCZ58723.1 peroxidase [Roseicella aquatilis]